MSVVRLWVCPNCTTEQVAKTGVSNVWHTCPGLRGLQAPMVPQGVKAKVEAKEREDYVGTDKVQLDPERGRPVMAVVTTRDEGQDVAVFAPTASARVKES